MSNNTQLSSPVSYNIANMRFGKTIVSATGADNKGPKNNRIPIYTVNDDGSTGDLIFLTEDLFSFGVSENKDPLSGRLTGYTLPLCLYNKQGATEAEKAFVSVLKDVVEKCKDYLLLDSTKAELKKFDLERSDLKKLDSFLYFKRDKDSGKLLEDNGPVIYAKLIESKKNNKFITSFFDPSGDEINPLDLIGKYCWAKSAIKVESIFVGSKISLQIKVYEAEVRPVEIGVRRLLSRPKADTKVSVSSSFSNSNSNSNGGAASATHSSNPLNDGDEEDDEEQIRDDEQEEEISVPKAPTPPPVVVEAPVRKVPRKTGSATVKK